jgi:hypothetical protein
MLACGAAARPAGAQGGVVQTLGSSSVRVPQRGTVRGVVRDSLLGAPLRGAIVQLVAEPSSTPFGLTVESDSLGAYRFVDVPVGRYVVGFHHPRLDSLGLEPPVHGVDVGEVSDIRADLAIPSGKRLRSAVCGGEASGATGAMLMGFVRSAQNLAPIAGADVEAQWMELQMGRSTMGNRLMRRTTTAAGNGWFVFCNLPGPGSVTLRATQGADSTDAVEFEMLKDDVERRELFLGSVRTTVVIDSVRQGDSLVTRTRTMRSGAARARGQIVRADNGRPLANATVSIANGPSARTNDKGEWVLTDVPPGTRAVAVRAVGYFPAQITLNVLDDTEAPPVALSSNKSVLETVKVRANYSRFADLKGFRERTRSGVGRYYNEQDIERRMPTVTSDLFNSMSGIYIEYGANGEKYFMVRGMGSDKCIPSVFLNGAELRGLDASSLDTFVNPARIIGIEVYQGGFAPMQFQSAMTGCGAIVFWTR